MEAPFRRDAHPFDAWASVIVDRRVVATDDARMPVASSFVEGVIAGAPFRTAVLVFLDNADLGPNSYQLFERCARVLSTGRGRLHERVELMSLSIGYS